MKNRQGPRGGTVNKYLLACYDLKNKCDNEIKFSIIEEARRLNISNYLGTFLKRNNIMNIDLNGFYKWNEKIPITNKLILNFLDHVSEINTKYNLKTKPQQAPTLFNSPHYIKDAIKGTVTVVPEGKEKEFIKRHRTRHATKQKVESEKTGLIRRFIKWIY